MDPHRFEDGNPSSFDPTVKVFCAERFADLKKRLKCGIVEIVVLCVASNVISNKALVEDLFNRITP